MIRSIITAIALALLLPACATARPDYDGTWKSKGDIEFVAKVAGNHIRIDIVDDDISVLYWEGTFPSKSTTIVSKANTEALSSSILGSSDKTKTFKYNSGKLRFKFSAMGTTRTVSLTK